MVHTPGSWRYDKERCGIFAGESKEDEDGLEVGNEVRIVDLYGAMGGEDTDADARLIASAPDLLGGCQAALAYLADPASVFPENREAATQIIRAAIDKAEGKK